MISHKNNFLQYVAQTSDAPISLEIKKAEGIYLKTTDGKRYIDLISGIGVSNLGHRNQRISQAIRKQVGKYLHTMVYGEYVQAPQVKLAKRLADLLPDPLEATFFVNSGSEAIEGALKLAKRYTGKTGFVAMKNAYHGSSTGALSLMSDAYYSSAYRPLLPGIRYADFNSIDSLSCIDGSTAGVVIEIVQGEAGYLAPDPNFLEAVRQACTKHGALLIVDEIQTGMGRTGSLFAFEQYNLVPDILCLAKAFGGGMPLGAFVSSKSIMHSLSHNPVLGHISTFGGHPVSCAAGYENLQILSKSGLINKVSEKEALFRKLLVHPKIKQITGKGLMLGLALESEDEMHQMVAHCLQNGIIIDWFLYDLTKLRIAPPLIIRENEIKKVCKVLLDGLNKL
ncbi:MAG: aspartate aminotransferase family protein [Bacteroidia bacterium]|nr:aspartate aminotransferase family protein [Bacteroidia bacterium]